MAPSTSYSIHFFIQTLSSFRYTCLYQRYLFCRSTEIMSSIPNLSCLITWKSAYFNVTHKSCINKSNLFNSRLSRMTQLSYTRKIFILSLCIFVGVVQSLINCLHLLWSMASSLSNEYLEKVTNEHIHWSYQMKYHNAENDYRILM